MVRGPPSSVGQMHIRPAPPKPLAAHSQPLTMWPTICRCSICLRRLTKSCPCGYAEDNRCLECHHTCETCQSVKTTDGLCTVRLARLIGAAE